MAIIYGTKCVYDDIKFDSIPERDYYIKLKLLKEEGKIKDYQLQIPYLIQEDFINFRDKKEQKIEYVADYVVKLNDDSVVVIDTKGSKSTTEEVARVKQKIFMYRNKEIPIYFIAPLPKYLGNVWVDVSKGSDFSGKLKKRYVDINGKWTSKKPNWKVSDWEEHFEFENFHGLFYIWHKTKTRKKAK